MVCWFIPSLGLFNVLYHFKAEQIPFYIWNRYNRTQNDKIVLYGLKETVLWGELDRWEYSTDNPDGIPPHYSEYTGLSLTWTFLLFFILSVAQLLSSFLVKNIYSKEFSKREDYLNKFLHLLLSLNLPSPYEDWDQEKCTVQEYKERHKQTNNEMFWIFLVNIGTSFAMLIPLWYTGKTVYYFTL